TERARPSRRAWVTAGLLAIVSAAFAVPAIMHFREAPRVDVPEMRLEITTPATSSPLQFALSPDGRWLAFIASGDGLPQLWVRSLDATNAIALKGTEGAEYPFWSPDSRSIGF